MFFKSLVSQALYCSPTLTTNGIYIKQIAFNGTGITGGVVQYTGANGGYTQTISSSSGTMNSYFGGSFFYSIFNPTDAIKAYDFALYVDWNNDGDFTDTEEHQASITGNVNANNSSAPGSSFGPPLNLLTGNYRVRFAVSQGGPGTATACGAFTGEVEDYIISIAANRAPVLTSTSNLSLNELLSSQINSNGISINEIVESLQPSSSLITDADDQGTVFTSRVPQGIAIYGQTASNGTWQYKAGLGNWTNFAALSSSNALLLLADAYFTYYQPGTRLRFVPTGTGSPTITLRAWDGTANSNGSYANIAATGGSSAFSTGSLTASMLVVNPENFVKDIYFASQNRTIYNAAIDKVNKSVSNADVLLANSEDYFAYDIDLDPVTNKLYWISGINSDKIASSNSDGSSVQLSLITGITYATGLAVGSTSLYYITWAADYSSGDIYKAKKDGTQTTKIFTGVAFVDLKDIEFYNDKLYFQYSDGDGATYHIASINTDGSGFSTLYSTSNYFGGLAVANEIMYWTESDGTVMKKGIATGSATQLVSQSNRDLSDLIVDDANSTIYFMDTDKNANKNYSLVRSVSTSGTGLKTVSTLSDYVTALTFNPSSVALPVTLISFAGRFDEGNVACLLSWKTSSEENNAKFILERCTDSRYFIPVATISGAGTSSAVNNYYYNDNTVNVTAKIIYYRLLQVDLNGKSSYSRIISLTRSGADVAEIKLWPNPGKGYFNVQLAAKPSLSTNIKVYSKDGRLILNDMFSAQEYQLNMASSQSGIYVVKLNFGDGQQKQFRIVKE